MERKIFKNEYVECVLDDSVPVLKHQWLKQPPGFEFKKNLKLILSEFNNLKNKFDHLMWLADTKKLGEVSEEVEEWLNTEWDRMLFEESGLKVHAVLLGEDIFADYPMEKFKLIAEEKYKSLNVSLGVFADNDSAYDWMKSKRLVMNR